MKFNAVKRMSVWISDGSGEMETVFFKGIRWMTEKLKHERKKENGKGYKSFVYYRKDAIKRAYADGIKKEDIKAFCVYSKNEAMVAPCGACRQVMSELLPSNCDIILAYGENNVMHTTMKELLPLSFTSEDMDND